MKHFALFAFLAATTGCYQLSSAVIASNLVGDPVADYIKRHGPPDRTMALPDGSTVATWYSLAGNGSHQRTVTYNEAGIITDFNHR